MLERAATSWLEHGGVGVGVGGFGGGGLRVVLVLVVMEVACEIDKNGRWAVRWFRDWLGFVGVIGRFDWFVVSLID